MGSLASAVAGRRTRVLTGAALCASLLTISGPSTGWATSTHQAPSSAGSTGPDTPYSGIRAPERGGNGNRAAPPTSSAFPAVTASTAGLTAGTNVDAIGGNDAITQATINGTSVFTCTPGKPTPQNETSIAVNPSDDQNLVGGANDYRLYQPTENRYDGAGGFYQSTDGGKTWSAGFLPGLVSNNTAGSGPYDTAGDPSISAGPDNTFWYSNLAFNRGDSASGVGVSRSTDGGSTWTTSFPIQTPASAGATLSNDKDWIAADPTNSNTAYVTWTQFHTTRSGRTQSSPIVISKTTDGGSTWSAPVQVSPLGQDQSSTVVIGSDGTVYVTFEAFRFHNRDWAAEATSTDGGSTFTTKLLWPISDIPSPLPGDTFRDNSFPTFAVDGSNQYVAWSNWNGLNAHIVMMKSTDGGATWSAPQTLAGGAGNQFFAWLSARGGTVAAAWYDDNTSVTDNYVDRASMSFDSGASWTPPVTVSSSASDVPSGNLFAYPSCTDDFIGDYNAVALDSSGTAHAMWTDIRDQSTPTGTNQDPYTATIKQS